MSRPDKTRILFILKKRHLHYGHHYASGLSSGLFNSAKFAAEMLSKHGFVVDLVEVTDNNDIDREVDKFKPNIVIIEALWVVPSKFDVLQKLHPGVIWVVRVHSEAAFLAQEGVAIRWLSEYPTFENVFVAANSLEALSQLISFYPDKGLNTSKLLYLPTYYPAPHKPYDDHHFTGTTINIACMGAIRVLKNNLIQAIAAMRFVDEKGWKLRFHINMSLFNIEGNAPYKSVIDLFSGTRHELVQHDWLSHDAFLALLRGIDVSMQVSLSETFDIVAADSVASGVPIVGSHSIRWLTEECKASTISVNSITQTLHRILNPRKHHPLHHAANSHSLVKQNLKNLQEDAEDSRQAWLSAIKHIT